MWIHKYFCSIVACFSFSSRSFLSFVTQVFLEARLIIFKGISACRKKDENMSFFHFLIWRILQPIRFNVKKWRNLFTINDNPIELTLHTNSDNPNFASWGDYYVWQTYFSTWFDCSWMTPLKSTRMKQSPFPRLDSSSSEPPDTGDKAAKVWSLDGFWKIENIKGSSAVVQ